VSLLSYVAPGLQSNCWAQSSVSVSAGANLQSLVNQYPNGTTFLLGPGYYRRQSIVPKSYDSFIGDPGAILSGADLLTSFTRNGSVWMAHDHVTQLASYNGQCDSNHSACVYPEDLFFDNNPKTRATSLSGVGPGKWYLDYNTGNIYMGDDPAGHTVEISLSSHAFAGASTSVTISNLVVEKYACQASSAAVDGTSGVYWNVGGNEVRYNHGMGIRSGDKIYIHDNKIHNNGELGMGGGGTSVLVQSNEISYNNYSGYSIYWEAGGAKFAAVQDLTFRYNYAHHNAGPGFWTDINSQTVLCDSNQFTANEEAAVLNELSSNTTISNNYIWNDGYNPSGTGIYWGAAILISNSSYASVYFNHISGSMSGIVGYLAHRGNAPNGQPYLLQNVDVNSNYITQGSGTAAGIVVIGTGFDNSVYTSWNNQFRYNTFDLEIPSTQSIWWMNQPMTFAAWSAMLGAN
jgi:hypothetical protein